MLAISSCVKDDICLEDTTPYLIIRFYDNDDPTELKEVSSLTVWSSGLDSLYIEEATDSIAIPLNLTDITTTYNLKSDDDTDEMSFTYTLNDIYVSRSCGYKTIYENLEVSATNNWIQSYTINNTTIEDETSAHITIYH